MIYDKMYKDFGVRPTPRKLADGDGWTQSVAIIVHHEDGSTQYIPYFTSNIFKTEEEAIARSYEYGVKIIDENGQDLMKPTTGGRTQEPPEEEDK